MDAFQGHFHDLNSEATGNNDVVAFADSNHDGGITANYGSSFRGDTYVWVGHPRNDGINGTPRTASETRPRNISLLACIKY